MKKIISFIIATTMSISFMGFSGLSAYADEVSADTAPDAAVATETNEPSAAKESAYSFNIQVVDESMAGVNDLQMHLERQAIEWTDDEHYQLVGDRVDVTDWNTSDSNPFISEQFTADEYLVYFVTSDSLPDAYTFYGKDRVEQQISGALLGEISVKVYLQHKSDDPQQDIPLSGSYSLTLNIADIVSSANIENLDCELYNLETEEVIKSWNTSEEPMVTITNLEYAFDSKDSMTGNIRYAIRILNLPENYVFFYGKSREFYGVSGFGIEEFENGNEISCTVYLEDTSEDAPKVTYVTDPMTVTTTTTTTTTESDMTQSTSDDVTNVTEETTTTSTQLVDRNSFKYPLIGTYSMTYRFVDAATGEEISGLECVYSNAKTGEQLYAWNTSDEPVVTINNLEYYFEDATSYDSCLYELKITNMPENYVFFYGKSKEAVYSSFNPESLTAEDMTFEEFILLENTDPDAPKVTCTTDPKSDDNTSTTTTTTTEKSSETGELPQTGYPFSTNDIMLCATFFILIGSSMTGFAYLRKKHKI